jgi:hypothetical protein
MSFRVETVSGSGYRKSAIGNTDIWPWDRASADGEVENQASAPTQPWHGIYGCSAEAGLGRRKVASR